MTDKRPTAQSIYHQIQASWDQLPENTSAAGKATRLSMEVDALRDIAKSLKELAGRMQTQVTPARPGYVGPDVHDQAGFVLHVGRPGSTMRHRWVKGLEDAVDSAIESEARAQVLAFEQDPNGLPAGRRPNLYTGVPAIRSGRHLIFSDGLTVNMDLVVTFALIEEI